MELPYWDNGSIIFNQYRCYRCGSIRNIHLHHVFAGSLRKKSDKYGLTVPLCAECHTGNRGVHNTEWGMKWWKEELMPIAQAKFEEKYGHELFMKEFRRNFLDVNE